MCSSKGVIPARDAGIQPYFHFYTKSKIRGFLCSSTQMDKPYFHFYTESKIGGFLCLSKDAIPARDVNSLY
ncbi:hypothetical protein [Wolbachia endosymbiont of Ctenocephalides felis wCfeJ]|uniref:hypothetical protein n=1 Tax=Wolbachia endosymbiont of Ctenocephalides felis wCfeJ TaxID=2732594 RepID=UPI001444BCFA|nr:hypothetical protein [Wolbachia endosymbiont of Ctenocephalides felis wCfeJ]